VEVVKLDRPENRPGGRRVGVLVHEGLRAMSADGLGLAARNIGASSAEQHAAAAIVGEALRHPLLERARQSERVLREEPVTLPLEDGSLLDGVIDLAFLEDGQWTVVDFKTDADIEEQLKRYAAQVQWYAYALRQIMGQPARAVLLNL
jgi:ATP-dependent exoDNAse (exonuclease V) beta subunit